MKIIALVSSYREDGNTNRIVGLIGEQLILNANRENLTLEIERLQLGHMDIKTCRGCRICFDKGEEKCPLKDDLLLIRDKLQEAEGILVASPVYVENVNGVMKNWIDRMAFISHRPSLYGKAAYIVSTAGIGASNNAVNTIRTAFNTWGIKFVGKSKFRTGALMEIDEMRSKHKIEIEKAAEVLFRAVRAETFKNPTLYSLIVFKVQQKFWQKAEKFQETLDYEYWKSNGWLERNCKFYLPYRTSNFKINFARLIGSTVSVFFI